MFDMGCHLRPLTPHSFMNVLSPLLRNVLFPSMVDFLFIKVTKNPAEKLFSTCFLFNPGALSHEGDA